jgi:hypothetical protein
MDKYYSRFVEEDIVIDTLEYVTQDDLERMDIKQVPQRKLMAEIAKLAASKATST